MTTQNPEAPTRRPTLATILSLVAVVMSAAALIVSLVILGNLEQQERKARVDECEKYGIGSMDYFMCAEQAQ